MSYGFRQLFKILTRALANSCVPAAWDWSSLHCFSEQRPLPCTGLPEDRLRKALGAKASTHASTMVWLPLHRLLLGCNLKLELLQLTLQHMGFGTECRLIPLQQHNLLLSSSSTTLLSVNFLRKALDS